MLPLVNLGVTKTAYSPCSRSGSCKPKCPYVSNELPAFTTCTLGPGELLAVALLLMLSSTRMLLVSYIALYCGIANPLGPAFLLCFSHSLPTCQELSTAVACHVTLRPRLGGAQVELPTNK